MIEGTDGLFARTEEFPNPQARARLAALVGLDGLIDRLATDAVALLDPTTIQTWSKSVHGKVIPAVNALADRTPLFVFAGDVGVGKTEVAEVIGQVIATRTDADVTLYPLSLTARGRGAVGEMTTLLTRAFERGIETLGLERTVETLINMGHAPVRLGRILSKDEVWAFILFLSPDATKLLACTGVRRRRDER